MITIDKVMEILNKYDPMGLLNMGSPEDEYKHEASLIYFNGPFEDWEMLFKFVYKTFVDEFDATIVPEPEYFAPITDELFNEFHG